MGLEKLLGAYAHLKKGVGKIFYDGIIDLSCVLVTLVLVGCKEFRTEPYIETGMIAFSEKEHKSATSHKSMIGLGVNSTSGEPGKGFQKRLGVEYWAIAEPVDEDTEVAHNGMAFSGRLSYEFPHNNTTIYPFAGLGAEYWARNSTRGEVDRFWGDLYFANVSFGLGVKHKNLYGEVGGRLPFLTGTDSGQTPKGEIGLELKAGVKVNKNLNFSLFHRQDKFGKDGTQTDFKLGRSGVQLGYNF